MVKKQPQTRKNEVLYAFQNNFDKALPRKTGNYTPP
jgi:hypothetical protein